MELNENQKKHYEDMIDFKPYPLWREALLSRDEMIEYYIQKRKYQLQHDELYKGIEWRKKVHPTLEKAVQFYNHKIEKISYQRLVEDPNGKITLDKNGIIHRPKKLVSGGKIELHNEKPVIYVMTHIGKNDYQIFHEALDKPHYPFAGDPESTYRTPDGLLLWLNGVIYCDTNCKEDRENALQSSLYMLNHGSDVYINAEGIWNLTSKLVLPLWPGVMHMAQAGYDIIPIAIEQYGNEFIINVGQNFEVLPKMEDDELNEKYIALRKQDLRDTLATLKWEIMEAYGITFCRKSMGTYEEIENQFIDERLNEYIDPKTKQPFYTRELVKSRMYREKGVTAPSDAFSYFKTMHLNQSNQLCFRQDISLPESIQKEIQNQLFHYYIDSEKLNNIENISQKQKSLIKKI